MTALITSVRVLYSVICFLSLFCSSLWYGFIGLEKRTLIHYIRIQCRKPPTTLSFCTRKHFVNQVCARTVEHSVKKRKLNIQIKWEMNKFGAQRIFPTCFFFSFSCETIKLLYRTMPLSICWILFSFRLYFCSCD